MVSNYTAGSLQLKDDPSWGKFKRWIARYMGRELFTHVFLRHTFSLHSKSLLLLCTDNFGSLVFRRCLMSGWCIGFNLFSVILLTYATGHPVDVAYRFLSE